MRIVYVYDAIYPYVTGGAERRYHELGTRLARRGHDVHFVGWQYWPGAAQLVERGVTLHGIGTPPPLHDGTGRRTFKEAFQFAKAATGTVGALNADLIDCSSIPYLPSMVLIGAAAVRRVPLRAPMVVTWHEFMGERWSGYFPASMARARLAQAVESGAARFGAHRIAVSEFTKQRLPKGPHITVIENGVDCNRIGGLAPTDDAPDVVVAGRLVPHKRGELLLEALALLPGLPVRSLETDPNGSNSNAESPNSTWRTACGASDAWRQKMTCTATFAEPRRSWRPHSRRDSA